SAPRRSCGAGVPSGSCGRSTKRNAPRARRTDPMAIAARIEAALGRGVILRDERGRATLHDADVDTSGPKYECIRTPAPGVRFIPRLVAKASGAGTLVLSEGAEVVPVGTSTAITLVNELRTDIMAHAARTNRHTTAVQDATGAPDAADDTESLLALTNW